MKVCIIYDETGRILTAEYGREIPYKETSCKVFDMADGDSIQRIDLSDKEDPKVVIVKSKESSLLIQIEKLTAQVEYLSMMSGVEMEVGYE
ncbi:hypothetical protein [Clostridium sp. HBUAS56010]|uniref:hypothetical protein n=1 Tax=Clostridium sp. HBUAS56010 TaxID=2571127 RepID=UPI0011779DE4|nr:hypothetical protein [Clostridium sp. HBUAS56010]